MYSNKENTTKAQYDRDDIRKHLVGGVMLAVHIPSGSDQSLCPLPVPVWSRPVPAVSWERATVAQGSSSFGSQGPAGRRGWASQAEGRCWGAHPEARWWEAGWPCWCNRAREEAGEQTKVGDEGEMWRVRKRSRKAATEQRKGRTDSDWEDRQKNVDDSGKDKGEATGKCGRRNGMEKGVKERNK